MKEKIIIFLIGLLLGAIISTGSIYVYSKTNNSNNDFNMQMRGEGNMGENGNTPPEIPNNDRKFN